MDKPEKRNLPVVSVIITTRNEEANIGNCLKSIKGQDYPEDKIEIIVVDNNSSDKTKQTALEFTNKVFNFGPERSAQRNFGVEKAEGKYILYLDADMILSPTIIEKAIEKFQTQNSKSPKFNIHNTKYNDPLVALYISEIVLGSSYWSRVRRFERSFYDGTVIDCVRFVRKSIFDEVGGFDLSMTGPEDWDFDKKVREKGKVEVLETAVIYHNEAEFNLKKYLKKKSYYAKSFSTYINKWSKGDPDIKKQFGFWYRYLGVFTEKGKWKKLLTHPILAVGMLALRFLVGLTYLFESKL